MNWVPTDLISFADAVKLFPASGLAEFLEAVNPNPNPQPQVPLTRDVENDIARARALTRRTS